MFIRNYPLMYMLVLILSGCQSTTKRIDFSAVEKGFFQPPDSIQTGVYWYWISGNISKEAVVKDLYSMKQVGINRAYIGNIGLSPGEVPHGKVKLFTDEWWDIMHTALKTASELNIQLGIFNCPGWSQSGGPWNKYEQSMRYLASSELRVKGPQKLVQKLKQPVAEFRDVKVLAWPVSGHYEDNLIKDGSSGLIFSELETVVDITLKQAAPVRSLLIYPAKQPTLFTCELQAKTGDDYKTIRKFTVNRSDTVLRVGFKPYAPATIRLPEIQTDKFRIIFSSSNKIGEQVKPQGGIERIILSTTPMMENFYEKTLAKMANTALPYWRDNIWNSQEVSDPSLITPSQKVSDISANMTADGTLTWDVPDGEWIISRMGMAHTGVVNGPASPEGTGREVDKMSRKHVEAHFDAFLGQILKRIPEADRKTWTVTVIDSYEAGGQNFTDGFLEEFQQRYGYDPVPWLPVYKGYIIGNYDLSERFLWDVRRLVADKVAYDYVGGMREVSHRHGLTLWVENYGHCGFPGEFLQYGGQSDEISGEFWSEGGWRSNEVRAASSCGHIYGKNKIYAESFTSSGLAYSRHPASLKRRGDWIFTEGVNSTVFHVNIQQPYEDKAPGLNAWFGNEFNRLNTYYHHLDLFVTYLKRAGFMLQQGLNVADIAYFIGEDVPKMAGVRDPEIPKGYQYDYINAEVIMRDLAVKDGRLVLPHGTSYRILVLPKEPMRPEVLQKIEKLVADGAVILGPPPSRSPSMQNYPEADQQIQALAAKMWGDVSLKQRTYGKGLIFTDMSLEEALAYLKVTPDCIFANDDPVLYVHRSHGGNEIYFITNQSDQTICVEPQFRVQGMQPEVWDAVTGKVRSLPAFQQKGEVTGVPLRLEAYESAFIVFRKNGKNGKFSVEDNYPVREAIATVSTPWEVVFESDEIKRGPAQPIVFEKLQDWSEAQDEAIRYYSGTARYKTTFPVNHIPKEKSIFLDLGQVQVMAKVTINGQYAGGVWTAPYRLDITQWLKEGDNMLEVEVVNTWMNRLIGDQRLPEKDRHAVIVHPWEADSPLQSSGLIGPVSVYGIKY